MSASEAIPGGPAVSASGEQGQPQAVRGCCGAARAGQVIERAMQRVCPCSGQVREGAERMKTSIRAQPIAAVLVALGVGLLAGRLSRQRDRTTGGHQ